MRMATMAAHTRRQFTLPMLSLSATQDCRVKNAEATTTGYAPPPHLPPTGGLVQSTASMVMTGLVSLPQPTTKRTATTCRSAFLILTSRIRIQVHQQLYCDGR